MVFCHNTSPIQNNAFFWFNRLYSQIRTPLHSTPRLHSMTPLRKLHGAIIQSLLFEDRDWIVLPRLSIDRSQFGRAEITVDFMNMVELVPP